MIFLHNFRTVPIVRKKEPQLHVKAFFFKDTRCCMCWRLVNVGCTLRERRLYNDNKASLSVESIMSNVAITALMT